MSFEQLNYSQVCTLAPQNLPWTYQLATTSSSAGSPVFGSTWGQTAYFTTGASQQSVIYPGDQFQLHVNNSGAPGALKESTVFTVQWTGFPGFGFINVFFTPQPQASIASTDWAVALQAPITPRWLGAIGHVSALVRGYTCPGGPSSLSLLLRIPPELRTDALNPGRVVQVWRGASCVWEGKLDEPAPTSDGWTVTAHGAGTYGDDFAAVYDFAPWGPDEPVNEAIGRGLRWSNPGIGKPTGIFLAQVQDSGSETVTAHLNLLISGGGLLWQVFPGNASSNPAGPWVLKVFPFKQGLNGNPTQAPDRILVCNTPVARTIAADINTIILRYQATADIPATTTTPIKKAVAATFTTTTASNVASVRQHGPMEYYLDISSAGVITNAAALAIGNNILARYVRASFAGPFTAGPGQVLNPSGTPVDLGCDQAGLVYQVMVTDASYGGEVAPGPLVFMSGAYDYDEETGSATITPFQSARHDLASLISSLYPVKF